VLEKEGGDVGMEDVADRLEAIAEELDDLAFDRLREASGAAGRGAAPDPDALAEERRLTRARRAVQKAVVALRGSAGPEDGSDP
jgi:hypothetical protein